MWPSERTMMIIDQTSSPRAHDQFFFSRNVKATGDSSNNDRSKSDLTRPAKHYVKTKNMCTFHVYVYRNIYIKSIGIMRHSDMTRCAFVRRIFSHSIFRLCHYIDVSSALGSKFMRSSIRLSATLILCTLHLCLPLDLLASFSIRLILIANTVINTAITLIVSLRLYGL